MLLFNKEYGILVQFLFSGKTGKRSYNKRSVQSESAKGHWKKEVHTVNTVIIAVTDIS